MCGKIPLPNHIPFPPSSPCVTRSTEPLGPQHRHPRARRRNWQAPGKTAATLVFAHPILGWFNFKSTEDMTWHDLCIFVDGSGHIWDSKFRSWQLQSIVLQPGPLHDTVTQRTSDGKSNCRRVDSVGVASRASKSDCRPKPTLMDLDVGC